MLERLTYFFTPRSSFSEEEWILRYQITAKLIFSFFFGIGIFLFSIVRFLEKNYIVSATQFLFAMILMYGFFRLRRDKRFYKVDTILFFIIFLLYLGIIFFYVPQNSLNILWIIFTPILIFFFLNKVAGIVMFLLIFTFILYLIVSGYHYNVSEFITLLAAFFVTTFMMYMYEKMKESESQRLREYNLRLKKEVQKQTEELATLNKHLEKRIQEELEKRIIQEKMLICQNRMANMGIMIDSIAHQWRQPLMHINAILMNISRVTESEPKNIEYIDEKIDNIFTVTEQMSQTINDFRNLFKPNKEKERFKLKKLINTILPLMQKNLKTIDLTLKIEKNLEIYSYQNELSQVLLTILQNAIEAFEEHNITQKEIVIVAKENNSHINITISDNAGGIAAKNLPHIFEPYFTTKQHRHGTGLGLYIAKIIIERSMGGEIMVETIKNGTKFTINLPKT
jgi:signal transduction histidine kinase